MHDKHTNAFIEMHGVPYLLAEYCDRDKIEQLDRTMICSAVTIDTSNPCRAVVDISMDDIGKRASDGMPNLIDNETKKSDVVRAVHEFFHGTNKAIPVIKSGIVARINYQLENSRTGEVIRSIYDDIRIPERQYFVSVTPDAIDTNSIVTNFTTTQVSSVNAFTHGRDKMTLRITSIQLCYEVMRASGLEPRGRKDKRCQRMEDLCPPPRPYEERYGLYEFLKHSQNVQFLGDPLFVDKETYPDAWRGYNRLYHFDNDYSDIILHMDDIYNRYAKTTLIECGKMFINRAFVVNPGERIVFKLSIWKNDLALFNDTSVIADALDYKYEPCHPHHHESPVDRHQDEEIRRLNRMIRVILDEIRDIKGDDDTPEPPDVKPHPPCPHPGPHPRPKRDIIRKLLKMIRGLQIEIQNIESGMADMPTITPITDEEIDEILDSIDDSVPEDESGDTEEGDGTSSTTADAINDLLDRIDDQSSDDLDLP